MTSCPGCLGMRDLKCPHQVSSPLALPGAHPLPRRAPACLSVASSSVPASSCPCPRPSRAQAGMLLLEVSLPAMAAGRDSRPPHDILWGGPKAQRGTTRCGAEASDKAGTTQRASPKLALPSWALLGVHHRPSTRERPVPHTCLALLSPGHPQLQVLGDLLGCLCSRRSLQLGGDGIGHRNDRGRGVEKKDRISQPWCQAAWRVGWSDSLGPAPWCCCWSPECDLEREPDCEPDREPVAQLSLLMYFPSPTHHAFLSTQYTQETRVYPR